ncbi:MAG: nitrate reductase cytochrome c-type subunit [Planctomycetota bacterium]
MKENTRSTGWFLALLVLSLVAAAPGQQDAPEVDDGLDVYFRGADLMAMSPQALEKYATSEPGESDRLDRAFEGAPPQIPHAVEDALPITLDSNDCLDCHDPENATSKEEAPLPESHFQVPVMGEGQPGEPMAWKVQGYEKSDQVAGARFLCTTCHAPQATNVTTMKLLERPKDAGAPKGER